MTEYIKREDAIDAVLDVYCDTPDIDLSCEKFERQFLKSLPLMLPRCGMDGGKSTALNGNVLVVKCL